MYKNFVTMNKKGIAFLFFLIPTSFLALAADGDTKWPQQTVESKPWTRWWWFGSAVDETNLTYNIGKLGEAGIGGVEITPIYGKRMKTNTFPICRPNG